jgi:serine/threonine-protein kinase
MARLWSELKRRNVVKVGIAYCAAGWIVIQVAAAVFPQFGAPEWLPKAVTTLVILGLPLALVFAWAFELTPDGIKRTEDVPRDASTRPVGRQLDLAIIAVLMLAVLLFVFDKFIWRTAPGVEHEQPVAAVEARSAVVRDERNSIAVLPFANLSNDPEQEYFSDGIAEELMAALARFNALKVAARASSFSFKGKEVDLHAIGSALNVATVLEGSVHKSGDQLRIRVQLSDVATGYQLWAETYDREMTDIFAVQDEITSRIIDALQIRLRGAAVSAAASSRLVDPDVYEIVLRGRYYWNQRSPEGFAKAAELLQEATRRAPQYAPAYSALADVYLSQFDYGLMPWDESTVRARAAATKALELDESSAAAHTSVAHILLHEWQWQKAEQHFQRAFELDPGYTLALHWYALCMTALGRTDEAIQAMQRAQHLDPLSVRINGDLGMALLAAGKYQEAIAQEERTLGLAPDAAGPRWIRGMALEQMGRFEAAEKDMKFAFDAWEGDPSITGSLGHLYAVSGRPAEAKRLLTELTTKAGATDFAFYAALICAGLKDTDAALTWLERAVDERSGSVRYLKIDPRLAALRNEPRYRTLMQRVGLTG